MAVVALQRRSRRPELRGAHTVEGGGGGPEEGVEHSVAGGRHQGHAHQRCPAVLPQRRAPPSQPLALHPPPSRRLGRAPTHSPPAATEYLQEGTG